MTASRPQAHAFASAIKKFQTESGKQGKLFSLPALASG